MSNEQCNNLSERLRFALNLLNISQTELAKRIKVKPQVIQYLCAGKSEKSKFAFEIAEALNIDIMWLISGKGTSPLSSIKNMSNERTIPLITFKQLRKWKCSSKINSLDKNEISTWLPISDELSADSFALMLNDCSMSPKFDINTIIIVDPLLNISEQKNAIYVLAYLIEYDFIIFRELKTFDDKKLLIPINKKIYNEIFLNTNDVILGICKEARWNN